MSDSQFSYEIKKAFGVIAESRGGWKTELNLVSWSGREPKYDLRVWAPDHAKMGKGITLSAEELATLRKLLATLPEDLAPEA
jgi:hypothetical protein